MIRIAQSSRLLIDRYRELIREFPFLARPIRFTLITILSFLIMQLTNMPLLWRLGKMVDWLHYLSIVGLLYGVFGGMKPYLKLNTTPKPYQELINPKLTSLNIKSSPGMDLVVGLSVMVIGVMTLAALIAIFPESTQTQDVVFLLISLFIFLVGVYFFIRSLRLITVGRFLLKLVSQLLSLKWWRNIAETLSNLSISVTYDKRNRIERLQDEVIDEASQAISNEEVVYETLRKLAIEDYLILEVKDHPEMFIQFHKMTGHVRIEMPLLKSVAHNRKLKAAIKVIRDHKIYKGFWLGQLQLNPDSYYFQGTWSNAQDTVTGNLLAVISKNDLLEATQLGLDLMLQAHGWDEMLPLEYTVNTFNEGWWSRL